VILLLLQYTLPYTCAIYTEEAYCLTNVCTRGWFRNRKVQTHCKWCEAHSWVGITEIM